MITMTDNAKKELEAFFADKPRSSVRMYLAPGGCRGPRLALALDDPMDEDTVLELEGFTFCINKDLLSDIGGAAVDLNYMGFVVEPTIPLAAPAHSCSGCSGSSGCNLG